MSYQTTDNSGNLIEIVPKEFMLQRYLSFGQYNDIEVMEDDSAIAKACSKVSRFPKYRIIRLTDGAKVTIQKVA